MTRPASFDYLIGLAEIERAADAGEMAPSNRQLAAALGAKSATAGGNCINFLERHGLIQVERFLYSRQITIVASGKSTARPKNPRPTLTQEEIMSGGRSRRTNAEMVSRPPRAAPRDPRPRCGVRADVGCSHGWQP